MKKEFIPYEQALELKELGFNKECLAYYDYEGLHIDSLGIKPNHHRAKHGVLAPLYQQALRWFREKYDLIVAITKVSSILNYTFVAVFYKGDDDHFIGSYNTYEEAELACIKKLIEIVKKNTINKIK